MREKNNKLKPIFSSLSIEAGSLIKNQLQTPSLFEIIYKGLFLTSENVFPK